MDDEQGALPAKEDFSAWYNELLWRAEIMDVRYPVKGLYVWFPFGFALRRNVYNELRALLDCDHQEALFPLLIPETELAKEGEHIKGFEDEVYWVTHGGTSPLDVKLALRPTSECAIYPMYHLWVRSHADLPIKLYQIVNSFRYETKHTRPLIRLREITSFKEAHTVHATWEDAERQVGEAVRLYRAFYDSLSIPVIISKRPDWDKFPGADYTIAVDTIMPDGRTLQIGTVHHLGDHFSKTFSITYEDINGEQQFAYQTCYGISERCIAAVISMHGDDRGLVLPPSVAPVQVAIVPITIGKRKEEVLAAAAEIEQCLCAAGIRVKVDSREIRPGAKYYYWEMRGVPLRLEVGPRDIDAGQVTVVTRLGEKSAIPRAGLEDGVCTALAGFSAVLTKRAEEHVRTHIQIVASIEELSAAVEKGVAVIPWCGKRECADFIEESVNASVLGTEIRSEFIPGQTGPCAACGREGTGALVGRSY
ncbi:MAG: proline--tRNA ligase [Methanomicrobiales archaeon]|nr:proline--tRNA ligase [Methanomicrobiales archaeon]NYT20623.1 proline--tRNA ligase [Methanomicrobiales archaeon]